MTWRSDRKRRRAAETPKDESEVRWLISYSDFMMQLVCLFILLYSVSSLDPAKAVSLVRSWRDEVGIGMVPVTRADVPGTIREMQLALSLHPGGERILIAPTSDGFRLRPVCEMFDEGSGLLSPQGQRIVDLAALVLHPYQSRVGSIDLVGHATVGEEGALRLSLSRAHDAFKWAARPGAPQRLDGRLLFAGGRGSHDPVVDTSAPRALNRRVDFAVRVVPRP